MAANLHAGAYERPDIVLAQPPGFTDAARQDENSA